MPKMNLIDIVQDIANDLDTDLINSINDNDESRQIAQIVKSTYYEIINKRDWPHLRSIDSLNSSGDNTKPNYMKLPETCREVEFINYNKKKGTDSTNKYLNVLYLTPDEFLYRQNQLNSGNSNVQEVSDFTGVKFYIRNDTAPTYYTTFDDEWIVFDSYDKLVDTTLQSSKTQVGMIREPSWTMLDTFIPDLPIDGFPLLVEEAKSTASMKLRQVADEKAEQKSSRQQRRMAGKMWRTNGDIVRTNYGRR